MLGRRSWIIGSAAAGIATLRAGTARASAEAHPWLAQSRRTGQATLRMLGLRIYEATLFTATGFAAEAWAAQPLVLEIVYRRDFKGGDIADRSLQEMRRDPEFDEGAASRWLAFMRRAFPDVSAGDRLTGAWLPAQATSRFAHNGAAPVELQDPSFGPRFFGIWLAPHSSRPELRVQLLGGAVSASRDARESRETPAVGAR